MNSSRFYLVDETDPDNPQQTEVTRSMPNQLMPTVEWEVPAEYEVLKVKVVVGYGNTDTYIYVSTMAQEGEDLVAAAPPKPMRQSAKVL